MSQSYYYCDQLSSQRLTTRSLTADDIELWSEFYKIPFFETSAKDNIGISDFIRKIISDVLVGFKPANNNIVLDPEANSKSRCKC